MAIIAGGGTGARMQAGVPKQFLDLDGKAILLRTIENVQALEGLIQVVVAMPRGQLRRARDLFAGRQWPAPIRCITGGSTRQDSVHRGVRSASRRAELFLVHDAVRPLCDPETMRRVLEAAWRHGGAVPALPATETIQRVSASGRVLASPPRRELFAIQTPQCFRAEILRPSLDLAEKKGYVGTDESSVARWAGHTVHVVPGTPDNIKITHPQDLEVAALLLGRRSGRAGRPGEIMRVGQGSDYHCLVEGRRLVLGGVEIPFEKGLEGHSDADALCHAICDALLGAAALGDIGKHFPNDDPAHRDRPSLEFVRDVKNKVAAAGWRIGNVDGTILAQRPRLAPYMDEMRRKLADALGLPVDGVNVKATTTEGMNAEGRGEGISAHAVALLVRR